MSFKDIKGQDKPIQMLKESMGLSRARGGYLFIGPEGVGKRLAAKTFAKALNCRNETVDSCDRCISCSKIDKGWHPDVHGIGTEGSDYIKIEHIRQLQKDIGLRPYEGRQAVFLVDDAHKLTPEAANALLKTLEEPPKDSLIILISDKGAFLFKTIISRCKIIKFYSLGREQLKEVLRKDYGLGDHPAHFLAYFCEGRIGPAVRMKDEDILREKNMIIDEFTISGHRHRDFPFACDKEKARSSLNIMASWFRDIYMIKIGMPHAGLINLDRRGELLKRMNHYTFADLDEIIISISNSLLYVEQNINTRLLLSNLKGALWRG